MYLRAGGVTTRLTHTWDGLQTRHLLEGTHTNTHKHKHNAEPSAERAARQRVGAGSRRGAALLIRGVCTKRESTQNFTSVSEETPCNTLTYIHAYYIKPICALTEDLRLGTGCPAPARCSPWPAPSNIRQCRAGNAASRAPRAPRAAIMPVTRGACSDRACTLGSWSPPCPWPSTRQCRRCGSSSCTSGTSAPTARPSKGIRAAGSRSCSRTAGRCPPWRAPRSEQAAPG